MLWPRRSSPASAGSSSARVPPAGPITTDVPLGIAPRLATVADDGLAGDRRSMICSADTLATANWLPSGLIERLHGFGGA